MPLRQYRFDPDHDVSVSPIARLAAESDESVDSPVHRLQRELRQFAVEDPDLALEPYPGWVRLAVPVLGSAGLWALIGWGIAALR